MLKCDVIAGFRSPIRLALRESTIRKMIFEKRLPVVRIGRTVTIPEDAIEKMISDGYSPAEEIRFNG